MSGDSGSRYLPAGVITEILSRLPVKDVLRCKIVCKTWYSLIKGAGFTDKHLLHCQSRIDIITVLLNIKRNCFSDIASVLYSRSEVCVPPPAKWVSIVLSGSCNGILFLRLLPKQKLFLLWNPATRECRQLPLPYFEQARGMGFGYDSRSSDYKVVQIGYDCYRKPRLLWRMSTNSWTEIGSELPDILRGYRIQQVVALLVKEKLFWLAVSDAAYNCVRDAIVISFDLGDETFRKITMPDAVAGRVEFGAGLIDFMGSLAFSVCDSDEKILKCFDIWVKNDIDDSWTKRFTIEPLGAEDLWPTRASIGGKFVMENRGGGPPRFFFYDPCSRQAIPLPFVGVDFCNVHSYCETLVSVKQNCEDHEYVVYDDHVNEGMSDADTQS